MTRWRAVALLAAVLAAVLQPSVATGAESVSLRLTSQTAWLGASGSFDLRLALDGVVSPGDVDVVLTVHSRVSSRSAFSQGIKNRPRGTVKTVTVPWESLPATGADERLLSMPLPAPGTPASDLTLPANLRLGAVYPVTVAVRRHGGPVLDRFVTHLIRVDQDPALAPLSVAWVQPVSARPAITAEGRGRLTDGDRAALTVIAEAVGDDPGMPMTLDVTPETIAALDRSDPDAVGMLRSAAATDQLLASPFVEIDPSALIAAGRADDVALQRQVGEDVLLATLGNRGDPRTWSSRSPLTPAAVAQLRTLGVTRLVVPERSLTPLDEDVTGGFTLSRPFALEAGNEEVVQAAAVDSGIASHFRSGPDQVLAAHQLFADLAVLFLDAPGAARGVVVRPPDDWRPSSAFLGAILPAIAGVPMLHPVTLDGLFDAVAPLGSTRRPVVRSVAPGTRVHPLPAARLAGAHQALDDLVALAGPTSDQVTDERTRLLAAESIRLSSGERAGMLASVVAARDQVGDHLAMPDRRTFRLTAREGTIPLTLVNDNPFPVRVDLLLSSDKLEFTDVHAGDRSRHAIQNLELEPGTHTMTIPVQARASGDFPLRATMSVPGGPILRQGRYTITSTVFSGVGVVLSIGAALFLALWWASNWRTVRRRRRLVEAPGEAPR